MRKHRIGTEQIFLCFLVLYIINQTLSESQYISINAVNNVLTISRYTILALVSLLIILKNKNGNKNIFVVLLVLVIVLITNLLFKNGGLSFIPIVLFIWGSQGFSVEKMMRCTCYTLVFTHLFVMLSSFLGIISDKIDYRYIGAYAGSFFSGSYARHNVGFLVHNQVALTFLVVYLMIIALWRDKLKWYIHAIVLVVNYYVFYYFGSRVVFLMCVFTCTFYYIVKFKRKRMKIEEYAYLSYPFLCLVSFIVALTYNSGNRLSQILDLFFNNRLRLSKEAIQFYGIHLLGSGQFAGTYNSTTLQNNTVDNGYISLFIQNGIIVALIIIGVWMYITRLASKKNNRFLVMVLVFLAIQNIVNSQIGSYKLIPFFCILFNQSDPLVEGKPLLIKKSIFKIARKRKVKLIP